MPTSRFCDISRMTVVESVNATATTAQCNWDGAGNPGPDTRNDREPQLILINQVWKGAERQRMAAYNQSDW